MNIKTTVTGHTVPQVESIGTLGIKTNHPRSYVIIDQVTGQVLRGARHEFALRSNLRDTDYIGAAQVLAKAAAAAGVDLSQALVKPLPTTVAVPGNGQVSIASMDLTAVLFAIALEESKFAGKSSETYKALVARRKQLGF